MLIKVQEIYKSAIKCNDCFGDEKYRIQRGLVSKAQPRWIGENYFSSNIYSASHLEKHNGCH